MGAVNAGKVPNLFSSPLQDVSCFAAGGLSDDDGTKSCHLELVITNCDLLTRLHFGCNVSHSDIKTSITTTSTSLTVDRKASQQSGHNISTKTLIILIVVIIVLFLVAVFFLSVWLRGCCRHRSKLIYQMPSQGEISQMYQGETSSVVSYPRSPTKTADRREPEFKFPPSGASIRRVNSRSETNVAGSRVGQLPLPPVPPPKLYWKDQNSSQIGLNSVKVKVPSTYAKPQDAIDPDFSEDGDVTSSNDGTQQVYSQAKKSQDIKQLASFYSSVPIRSIDV